MNGKTLGIAFAGGFMAGVLLYLWDVTVGPTLQGAVGGLVGSVGGSTPKPAA